MIQYKTLHNRVHLSEKIKTHEDLKIYDAFVSKCTRFERKGKTMPYTSANGYMFSLFNKAGEIGIRFSKDVQEKYIEEFNTTIYKSYGAVMQGYILIPESMYANSEIIVALLNESYEYVMSLDPK
ncbi:MAG: hypothetical protein P8Q86_02420 [Polaribacter sp.]|nr:hypothetical protein [Polaribacter sp.]